MGYLRNILKDTTKSVFEHVLYDSAGVERTFAEQLEKNESVKVYAKLPAWFKVPTPLGSYNPDWAVLVEIDGEERLYFVAKRKAACLRTICATTKRPRSPAARRIFRRWQQDRI